VVAGSLNAVSGSSVAAGIFQANLRNPHRVPPLPVHLPEPAVVNPPVAEGAV